MALPRFSLLAAVLLSLLSLSTVSARPGRPFHPCNTLIISTFSLSLSNPNPNNPLFPDIHRRPSFIAVVSSTSSSSDILRHRHHRFFLPNPLPHLQLPQPNPNPNPNSFKDRTKDILSVVASLLFGAACGALTAATMFLVWSLFYQFRHGSSPYRSLDGFQSDDDNDDNDDDDDIFNPKKTGYVTIPATPVAKEVAVDADQAKESA